MFANYKVSTFNRVSFDIYNVDLSIVNALRRIIITDIPSVALEDITILKNDGPLHNEFMSHRISLIPIHLTDEQNEAFSEDDFTFELDASNTSAKMVPVTSKEFVVTTKDGKKIHTMFPANDVTKDHVLITRLRSGESLHIKGHATKKTARENACFSPVSLCTFKLIQDPVEANKVTSILDKERKFKQNEFGDPTEYTFEIEVENGLSVRYLFSKALDILHNKVSTVLRDIYTDDSAYVSITPANPGFEFTFVNEDDTLGSFLQSMIHNHYIRGQALTKNSNKVSYAGYFCPHPLDTIMKLKICIDSSSDMSEHIDVLAEQCRRSLLELETIKTEWLKLNS